MLNNSGRLDKNKPLVPPVSPVVDTNTNFNSTKKLNSFVPEPKPKKQAARENTQATQNDHIFSSAQDALKFIRKVLKHEALVVNNENIEQVRTSAFAILANNNNATDRFSFELQRSERQMLTAAFKKLGYGSFDAKY